MTTPQFPSSDACRTCGSSHPIGDSCPFAFSELRVGSVVDGKYQLTRLIGEGGMGVVFEGRHRTLGRRVAVKFLRAEIARRPEIASRFANEARAAGSIEHENIAAVYDVGALPNGAPYLVMEFLDGVDLAQLTQSLGCLPLSRALKMVSQACVGIDVVHKRGIVHRDLKPSNLFVTERADGTDLIKIIDFGIAKLTGEGAVNQTDTGIPIGTVYYMSPEQARGEREVGAATDIYALGVILYELLTGRRPYDGSGFVEVLHKLMLSQAPSVRSIKPEIPAGLEAVVVRAMAPNAADRYPSALALYDALAPYATGDLQALKSAERASSFSSSNSATLAAAGISSPSSGADTVGPQVRSGALDTDALARKRRKTWATLVGASVAFGLAGGGVVALSLSGGGSGAAHGTAEAPSRAAVAPLSNAPAAPMATPSVALSSPVVTIAAPAAFAPSPAELPHAPTAPAVTAPPRPVPAAPVHAVPTAAARSALPPPVAAPATPQAEPPSVSHPPPPVRPAPNCDPPFTLDESGHHLYKPECIK